MTATFALPSGKWPTLLRDSVFIDSTHFLDIFGKKFTERVMDVVERHRVQNPGSSLSEEQYYVVKNAMDLCNAAIEATIFQDYAFTGVMKGTESAKQYHKKRSWAYEAANLLLKDRENREQLENAYTFAAPIATFISGALAVAGLIADLMLCVLAIMIFLAYILINQLVAGSLRAKTYENAMLRCLGWNQSHIVFIISSRILLFQAVPAAIAGLLLTGLAT